MVNNFSKKNIFKTRKNYFVSRLGIFEVLEQLL